MEIFVAFVLQCVIRRRRRKKKLEPTFVSEEETGFLVSLFINPTTVRSPGTLQEPGGQRFKNKKHHEARQSEGETRPRLHVNEACEDGGTV